MTVLQVQPTKWTDLPDADDVTEFSSADAECLREIRDVLRKHNSLERFGVTLLHTHFDVADDEMLLETTDVTERTQFIRPVKKADYTDRPDMSIMTTSLRFVEGEAVAVLNCGCLRDKHGHTGRHT